MDAWCATLAGRVIEDAVKIRDEQFDAITAAWRRLRRAEYASKLRGELGGRIPTSNQVLEKKIEDGWTAALRLGIGGDSEIYRFLRLMFVETTWDRPGLQEVTYRVLTDTSLSATQRIDFVERTLLDLPRKQREEPSQRNRA
jgi:O-methyltransferase involved in polyketide biosynthesis